MLRNFLHQVADVLKTEGQSPQGTAADLGQLIANYNGYKQSYLALNDEIGHLRAYAAPYIRPDTAVENTADKPSIFIVTLPKSATVYIANSLAQSLDYHLSHTLVTPTYPKNIVWTAMVYDFSRGGMISASHMQPDEYNFRSIKQGNIKRGILHVRDPRAALLSWVHFRAKRGRMADLGTGQFENPINDEFSKLDFNDKVDRSIDNFFRECIDWLTGWANELDKGELDFLVMTHDELKRDESAYFRKVLDFYNIDADMRFVSKDSSTHFRSGDNDEWRTVLTDAQMDRINSLMPDWMFERFDWRR